MRLELIHTMIGYTRSRKKLARISPVNMAKTIENAMRDCVEMMVEQVTDQVVMKLEKLAANEKKDEIRRGKQVEATPEENEVGMSDIEFEPGATFSEEENVKVARIVEEMEVEEQELEASKHTPVIPPGEKRQEFLRYTPSGQVTIVKRPAVVLAVPEQREQKEVKKPEVKETPKGPKAGGKKLEVKKPAQQAPAKKPEEKKKYSWAQKAAAPPPPKKQPEQ